MTGNDHVGALPMRSPDSPRRQMSTTLDGRPFRVSAWTGDGAQQDDLLKLVGRVFDTFVIR